MHPLGIDFLPIFYSKKGLSRMGFFAAKPKEDVIDKLKKKKIGI